MKNLLNNIKGLNIEELEIKETELYIAVESTESEVVKVVLTEALETVQAEMNRLTDLKIAELKAAMETKVKKEVKAEISNPDLKKKLQELLKYEDEYSLKFDIESAETGFDLNLTVYGEDSEMLDDVCILYDVPTYKSCEAVQKKVTTYLKKHFSLSA